jgi:hypothetical protein
LDLISEASLIDSAKACAEVLLLSMGNSILLYIGCPYEEKILQQFRLFGRRFSSHCVRRALPAHQPENRLYILKK